MTRQPHDQLAKEYLEELLAPLGEVKTSKDVKSEVYFLPKYQKAAIVAINQLPMTEDILWLRVLGKGRIQMEAISKVVQLSKEDDKWDNLVAMFASWRKNLELNSDVNDEEVTELIRGC